MTAALSEQRALRLRPVTAADDEFMLRLVHDVKGAELAPEGLTGAALDELVDLQRRAQDAQHSAAHPTLSRLVVVVDDQRVGRLLLAETSSALHVVNIALLETHRGQGIGTCLMLDVQECAKEVDLAVTLEVVKSNPARRLFERLGFTMIADGVLHVTLSWSPLTR